MEEARRRFSLSQIDRKEKGNPVDLSRVDSQGSVKKQESQAGVFLNKRRETLNDKNNTRT